jgi:hypothetical protein
MPIGKVQKIVLCSGSDLGGAPYTNASPAYPYLARPVYCPDGQYAQVFDAYLIDANGAAQFEAAFGDFDYTYASGIWALAFSMVVGLYAVSRGFGTVLGFIRRG